MKRGRLERERLKRGLSLNEIAALLGVQRSTVWRWEKGLRFPGPEFYKGIAEVYGVGHAWLVDQGLYRQTRLSVRARRRAEKNYDLQVKAAP